MGRTLPEPLAIALADANARIIDRLLAVLAALRRDRVAGELRRALASRDLRARANAVEALASLSDRRRIAAALPLVEAVALGRGAGAGNDEADAVERARRSRDPWLRRAAARVDGTFPAEGVEEVEMELLLFLKRTRLFGSLPLDVLLAVSRVLATQTHVAGETVFVEGSPGHHLYLVRSGAVEVRTDGQTIARLGVGSYLGEMALIDDAPRSATAVAAEDCTLLRLDRATFHELTEDHPAILRELCHLLAANLRDANARLTQRSPADSRARESSQHTEN
jgi:CRP-like cAMP-binding protein